MDTYDYYYDVPFNLSSKKEMDVLDQDNKVQFVLQRFNQNWIDALLVFRDPKSSVNIVLKNPNKDRLVEVIDAWSWRRKFHISYTSQPQKKIVATEVNNTKLVSKKLQFEIEGKEYIISKGSFDKRTTLSRGNEDVIWMEHNKVLPPRTNYIKVLKRDVDIKLALCILHAFDIGV